MPRPYPALHRTNRLLLDPVEMGLRKDSAGSGLAIFPSRVARAIGEQNLSAMRERINTRAAITAGKNMLLFLFNLSVQRALRHAA